MACATTIGRLALGRGRYTVMLREDGMVMDDGTAWRLEDQRYLLTSSTGGADRMAQHLSWLRNVVAPDLKASVVNVQEHLGAVALAGPRAAAVLAELIDAAVPAHMRCARAMLAGIDVLVLAASYSGERAFEIYAPGHDMAVVWQAMHEAVVAAGGGAYGLDAMDHLRVEKGHVVIGAEVDGRVTLPTSAWVACCASRAALLAGRGCNARRWPIRRGGATWSAWRRWTARPCPKARCWWPAKGTCRWAM
jgi:sarcosine oxidase subunit alpha